MLRIASWNIHGSVGSDRRCDPARILDVVSRFSADVLALQEVDGRTHLGRRARAFETFAEALGGHRIEARTVRRPERDYGHLLWSRWPLVAGRVRKLPGGAIEPRAAIDAVVGTPGGPFRVMAVHLGLFPRDRHRQATTLGLWAGEGAMPTVLLGDLNEWRDEGPVHRALAGALPVRAGVASWPARWPLVAFDRLYASSDLSALRRVELDGATRTAAARASDHLPLVVDIEVSAAS